MKLVNAMFWRPDLAIDELRTRSGWTEFHREAGKRGFYFDLLVKDGKRYKISAFTVSRTSVGGWSAHFLAEGAGKTPLEAFEAVYRATGRCDDVLDALMLKVKAEAESQPIDNHMERMPFDAPFEDIFDDASVAQTEIDDEFDALFG